jgi:hypothetical protein
VPMPDPRQQASPHRAPWYYALSRLFRRTSHPISAEADEPGDFMGDVAEWWERQFRLAGDRRERYRIFDEMDTFDLVMSILDVYAEETTQPDYDKQRSVWIESKNPKMVARGEECLRNCAVEDRIAALVRRIAKYGDAFQRTLYATGKGVLGWRYVSPSKVHRLEDKFGRLIGFREDGKTFRSTKRPVSWPWDYIHFRLLGKDEESGYGTAMLEAMFRPWRQLALAEDSVLMYRLRRAPDRNLIEIDVGDMEEHEAMQFVNAWRKRFRKSEFVDPASPDYKKQYNPLTPLEDIWLPKRPEQATTVQQLSGSGDVGNIADLDHFRRKFFGTARVPQAYFGFEGEIAGKSTLLQQDVRFARGAKRLRKAAIFGLRQLLDIHFGLLSTGPDDKTYDIASDNGAYLVQMSPIAYLDEFERLELVQLRYQIIDAMSRLANDLNLDAKVWATYVLLNYAKLPEDLVTRLINKTPPGPPPAAGGLPPEGGAETPESVRIRALLAEVEDPRLRGRIEAEVTRQRIWTPMNGKGYYNIDAKEARQIAEAIHQSAGLRRSIFNLRMLFGDDLADMQEAQMRQTDKSLLPISVQGQSIADAFEDDQHARELREDLTAAGIVVADPADVLVEGAEPGA